MNSTVLEKIKRQLDQVPTVPGVYLWKDDQGRVIYVGKAKQLRARMRQYVNFQDERAKIPLLVDSIRSFEYIETKNEYEALVLEKNLIKQYSPYFNADFKDDKSYPFIAITKGDVFPAIKFTREKHKASSEYFGPYTDSRAARQLIDIARRVVPVCSANCTSWKAMQRDIERQGVEGYFSEEHRPCFDCHVGIGPGACSGDITPEEYASHIERIERFLRGNRREFINELTDEMQLAAADLDFERAARLKDRIITIREVKDRQSAVLPAQTSADVIGFYCDETIAGVHVLSVREGIVINGNEFVLDKGTDVPEQDLLHAFLMRYYDTTTTIPREIICAQEPDDKQAMEEWLTKKLNNVHGARVRFTAPSRGPKHDLLVMAQANAKHTLSRYKVRTNFEDKRINEALLQLESALALEEPPMRIECYDISTLHGSYTVASMVVFTDGRPDKSQYRRFKIRTELDEANDFLSMKEVLGRRFAPERMKDSRFGRTPDLVIVDGGAPQLTAAREQLAELGLDIPMAGLAKRDEELFVPWQDTGPVVLPSGSPSLYLVKHVRDESHRFAISFHRELRGKDMTSSILDEVAGIGPVRKKALLRYFKSFKNLRNATEEEIIEAHIVPDEVAHELAIVLRQYNDDRFNSASTKNTSSL